MKKTRSQIFEELDVYVNNPRWAWCAKNDSLKLSVFTIWKDLEENGKWILHDNSNLLLNKRLGAKNQKEILNLSIDGTYSVFGLVAEAVNTNESPRSIKNIDYQNLVRLKLIKKGDDFYGEKIGIIPYSEVLKKNKLTLKSHGLLDLECPPIGKDVADRAKKSGFVFKRDTRVRKFVLNRAQGKCEYCKELGFKLNNGQHYLETHHIISLASQGADTLENVIALCANHHRQAHFGVVAVKLEKEFEEILKGKIQTD